MYILITTIICFWNIYFKLLQYIWSVVDIYCNCNIIYLFIEIKNRKFVWKIIICSIAGIFLYLANLLSMLVTTFIFNISTLEIYTKIIMYSVQYYLNLFCYVL